MQSIQENGNLKNRVHKNSNNILNNEIQNISHREQNQQSKRNSQYGQNLEIQHHEQSYQNLSSVLSSQVMNTVEQELLDKQEEYHVNTRILCFYLYPQELQIEHSELYYVIAIYAAVQIWAFLLSLSTILILTIISIIICKYQKNKSWINIGLYPLFFQIYENGTYVFYFVYFWRLFFRIKDEDIPILIYGFLVYVLFASIIIVYKGVKDLANRTSRSPHIMLYEDPQTYQADIEKILKIKNEIFMERLEWKEFSKLQHKLEKKNLKLKYKPHNIERCQSDQQIKQYQEEIQSIQNENPLNINHKQISYS